MFVKENPDRKKKKKKDWEARNIGKTLTELKDGDVILYSMSETRGKWTRFE